MCTWTLFPRRFRKQIFERHSCARILKRAQRKSTTIVTSTILFSSSFWTFRGSRGHFHVKFLVVQKWEFLASINIYATWVPDKSNKFPRNHRVPPCVLIGECSDTWLTVSVIGLLENWWALCKNIGVPSLFPFSLPPPPNEQWLFGTRLLSTTFWTRFQDGSAPLLPRRI